MTLRTFIFVLTLGVAAAAAQSGIAPIDAAHRAAKAASSRTAESNQALNAQAASATAAKPAPVTAAPAAVKNNPPKSVAKAVATRPATRVAVQPKAKQTASVKAQSAAAIEKKDENDDSPKSISAIRANRRDPFVSIIRTDKGTADPCMSGKKCLVIGDIVLRGIVRSPSEVIAVVENPQKKTYFLHENDPVFNGAVVKITSDAVVFREQIFDRAGRSTTREITKHLNTRPIA
jgi:hypothetical protein